MFETRFQDDGQIVLSGRFDASQVAVATDFFQEVSGDAVVDFSELEYISSAGLGILLATQKRLKDSGSSLRIINASQQIRDILRFSGLDRLFDVD